MVVQTWETLHVNRPRILTPDWGSNATPIHMFNAFFTTKSSGMGMGLSICRSGRLKRANEQHRNAYSITSSARPSNDWGTIRPNIFAVLRLMIISTFVARWTARSAGFSPLRIRPV